MIDSLLWSRKLLKSLDVSFLTSDRNKHPSSTKLNGLPITFQHFNRNKNMSLLTLLTDLSACHINHDSDYLHWMEPSSSYCSLTLFKQLVYHKSGATCYSVLCLSIFLCAQFCILLNPRSKITAAQSLITGFVTFVMIKVYRSIIMTTNVHI